MVDKNCKFCGKVFKSRPHAVYCSPQCKEKAVQARRKEREESGTDIHGWKHCEICDGLFWDKSTSGNGKYCSQECKVEAVRLRGITKREKKGAKEFVCIMCGTHFPSKAYGRRKFCSAECAEKSNRMRSAKNYNEEMRKHKRESKKADVMSIAEVQKAARAEHMSYGEYVSKYGV